MSSKKKTVKLSRRQLLYYAGLGCLATAGYSYQRGVRFPRLSWEYAALGTEFSHNGLQINVVDLINTSQSNSILSFRAYTPEPGITFSAQDEASLIIKINNVAVDATLTILEGFNHQIQETINGIRRELKVTLKSAQSLKLKWKLPPLNDYTFAAIGDTGGDKELAWCIERAHQLGARFFLHLGDFNYQEGDYQRAIQLFHNAPLPCYITIGNHDFHNSGLIYQDFLTQLGPLSYQFAIGKTRFANLDTAASVLPYHKGHRANVIAGMIKEKGDYNDTVTFTHCPLYDPLARGDNDDRHDIGSEGERDWLINALKLSNANTLLSGHIHIHSRETFDGIDNIIVGQGLGHQDLMANKDVSKMAVGHVNGDGFVDYDFAPLAMPMELHCHPHIDPVKQSLLAFPHADEIRKIDLACKQAT